jgi:hypothetical protein
MNSADQRHKLCAPHEPPSRQRSTRHIFAERPHLNPWRKTSGILCGMQALRKESALCELVAVYEFAIQLAERAARQAPVI